MNTIDFLRKDGSMIVNKRLAKQIGIESAIMFSELVSRFDYFEKKGKLVDGFFFNTIENFEEATTLSEYQQTKSIKTLIKLKLIEKKLKGVPPKRYFKICTYKVVESMLNSQLPKN